MIIKEEIKLSFIRYIIKLKKSFKSLLLSEKLSKINKFFQKNEFFKDLSIRSKIYKGRKIF